MVAPSGKVAGATMRHVSGCDEGSGDTGRARGVASTSEMGTASAMGVASTSTTASTSSATGTAVIVVVPELVRFFFFGTTCLTVMVGRVVELNYMSLVVVVTVASKLEKVKL